MELQININKLIISIIEKEPYMYNKCDPDYKKKEKKRAVFEMISQAIYVYLLIITIFSYY